MLHEKRTIPQELINAPLDYNNDKLKKEKPTEEQEDASAPWRSRNFQFHHVLGKKTTETIARPITYKQNH